MVICKCIAAYGGTFLVTGNAIYATYVPIAGLLLLALSKVFWCIYTAYRDIFNQARIEAIKAKKQLRQFKQEIRKQEEQKRRKIDGSQWGSKRRGVGIGVFNKNGVHHF